MTALICGSLAYDNIMVFQDRFKNHILPHRIHILNVCFLVPEMRREFGGCAGNIAYNLKLLGADALPVATVGRDFDAYAEWLDACGISRRHVKTIADQWTAQAFITTDLDDNQITAFHPGAMSHSHKNPLPALDGVRLAIISPDGREGMLEHTAALAEAKVPIIFDPGQGLPMFEKEELLWFLDRATYVTVNDYEWQLLHERTGLSPEALCERLRGLIVTLGAQGSCIYAEGRRYEIPAAKPRTVRDPTGCGDAYRAGLILGLLRDLDWETTGRIASLMGAIKIEHYGTQNHRFAHSELTARYEEGFGARPPEIFR